MGDGGEDDQPMMAAINPSSTPANAPGLDSHRHSQTSAHTVAGHTAQAWPKTAGSARQTASDPASCMRF